MFIIRIFSAQKLAVHHMTNKINDFSSVVVDSRKKTRESGHRFVVFSFIYPRSFESKERYIINKYKKFNLVIDIN